MSNPSRWEYGLSGVGPTHKGALKPIASTQKKRFSIPEGQEIPEGEGWSDWYDQFAASNEAKNGEYCASDFGLEKKLAATKYRIHIRCFFSPLQIKTGGPKYGHPIPSKYWKYFDNPNEKEIVWGHGILYQDEN